MNSDLEQRLKQLVMNVRHGPESGRSLSYETLLRELSPFLRRNAAAQLNLFSKTQYADDVTQETLLAVHLKLHTYDETMPFLAWVRAVSRHKLIDLLRRLRLDTEALDDAHENLADTANIEAPAIASDLSKLLNQLKPPAGELIYALRVEGATVHELAQKFKLSESNIKILVHRGLQRLSMLIGAETIS